MNALPNNFVYLDQIAPSIQQEIRYAGAHNVIGRPIAGYQADTCILTTRAAYALAAVQKDLRPHHLALKVYDCYRPTRAVQDLLQWSADPHDQKMKAEFYPRVEKQDLFAEGYFALRSGHSRGSTVDLTLVPVPTPSQPQFNSTTPLSACYAPYKQRFHDNSLDMGTGYDCLDESAFWNQANNSAKNLQNRRLLRFYMQKHGFEPYSKEWWHFGLADEPYPQQYFNFLVR